MDILKKPRFENIYEVNCFAKELHKLFCKDNFSYNSYLKWLYPKLKLLDELGVKSTDCKSFEKLKGCSEPIYSIRYPSKNNPRILYVFFPDDHTPVLLTAIFEKDKSDYDKGCAVAISRIRSIRKEFLL